MDAVTSEARETKKGCEAVPRSSLRSTTYHPWNAHERLWWHAINIYATLSIGCWSACTDVYLSIVGLIERGLNAPRVISSENARLFRLESLILSRIKARSTAPHEIGGSRGRLGHNLEGSAHIVSGERARLFPQLNRMMFMTWGSSTSERPSLVLEFLASCKQINRLALLRPHRLILYR